MADTKELLTVCEALQKNNIGSIFVETIEQAKEEVLKRLSPSAEIMQMSSETLRISGISTEINESGNFKAIRPLLAQSDGNSLSAKERTRLACVPDIAVGSAQAVTEAGQLVFASLTGSQLPAYVYGASKVILVIGKQKIVKDLSAALKRIYEYVLPLESERVRKTYGNKESSVNKILIINKEATPERIFVIIVNQEIGF